MIKLASILVLSAVAVYWLNPGVLNNFKQKAIEAVNPAAKGRTVIEGMHSNLDEMGKILKDENLSQSEKDKKIESILDSSRALVSEIEKANEKSDLTGTISNLLQKAIPIGQKESPEPTWLPPLECP